MSKRLASFRGPSTPSASPAQQRKPSSSTARSTESTFHRRVRTWLLELRAIAQTWDDLVLIDGLKAARTLVDTRTELDNALLLMPDGQHRSPVVTRRLAVMEKQIIELDAVVAKLNKQFHKMTLIVESMEAALSEAHRMKGWTWVAEEPLWVTWPLEKFVTSIAGILVPYHRSLHLHTDLVKTLRSHSLSFEGGRDAIAEWVGQFDLQEDGWKANWEDLCAVEVERWNV